MAVLARERARAKFQDWEKKDKEFDFNQSNSGPTPTHVNYWKALKVVCDWELDRAKVCGQEMGLHSSIEDDVMRLLQGKTHSELEALQTNFACVLVRQRWLSTFGVAILNKQLHIYKAKACLKEVHAKLMLQHLQCRPEQPETQEAKEEEKEDDESFSPQLLKMKKLLTL
ncbi:hypothetical protein LWI28_021352 [Acer negundo]|uniref:Splicing factor cactin central domain-containing protein n=1 Tax=Acer negundo TaxID=4023 RepID=A0AAD5JQZ5_ACENE|nr:hypothetical protein LWI28_021352 [Acer negundo]KAK4858659.1 hypothetical protein QYF36_020056 [Acer negundo]